MINMMDFSKIIKNGEKELAYTKMEINLKAPGKTGKLMDMESIVTEMEHSPKDIGNTIYNTDMDMKSGEMDQNIRACIIREIKMDTENIHGVMGRNLKESGLIIIFMAKENIFGTVVTDGTKVIGKIITWKVRAYTHIKTDASITENFLKTRNTELAHIHGLMAGDMKENGKTENNMEMENY